MKKIRLTRVTVVEYEVNPELYPRGWTVEQMAQYDAKEDEGIRDEIFSGKIESEKVTYEIIDNESEQE